MSPLVCRTPACPGLLRGRRGFFVRSTVVAFWGHALLSVVKPFSLCWLAALRGAGGALGCFRHRQIWLLFVFCRCFRTGCRGGGVSLFCARFALALRSFSRLRLFLFEADLEEQWGSGKTSAGRGFCVSMLPLVRNTPDVRGSWSSCVSHDPVVVKLSPLC